MALQISCCSLVARGKEVMQRIYISLNICNLFSSGIAQNVLYITGNEQTGVLTAGNEKEKLTLSETRKILLLLSIDINDNNNSCTALCPVRARVTLNSALLVVCAN